MTSPVRFNFGDTVRLTALAARSNPVTLDVRNHPTAVILGCNQLIGDFVFLLDRELAGTQMWLWSDLVLVKRGKRIEPVTIHPTLKAREGFTPSNFPPDQQQALVNFEAADEANQGPAKDHTARRRLRKNLANAYWAVCDTGCVFALCTGELERVKEAGVTVPDFIMVLAQCNPLDNRKPNVKK